jgi:hypothetical protein
LPFLEPEDVKGGLLRIDNFFLLEYATGQQVALPKADKTLKETQNEESR